MVKKAFQKPELHVVDIQTDKTMTELAAMSDEDLFKELSKAGYFENKACYQAAENFVSRNIGGETVLVPVGEQAQKLNGFATFTETGQFLWELLEQKKCTKADLVHALSREYNCSKEQAQQDVELYLEKMMINGFIVQCS